ncbi:DNA repair protein RecO [Porphyromonas crevioricanis]
MQITTRAIVLHRFRYNDTNSIAHLYSREAGKISCIFPEAKGSRRGGRLSSLISPPIELEFVTDIRRHNDLCRLSQVQVINPMPLLRMDPVKQSISLFVCELLHRILGGLPSEANLYDFIAASLSFLDSTEKSAANFHLCFLLRLLDFLGFSPDILSSPISDGPIFFDLKESCYSLSHPAGPSIPPRRRSALVLFARISYANMHLFQYSRNERREILEYLLAYYRLHLPPFGELRTLSILSELFN